MKKKTKRKTKAEEIVELKETLLRAQADFDNAQKRISRDQEEFLRFANSAILTELISINDDLNKAINTAEEKHKLEDFLKGVELISTNLNKLLEKHGLEKIKTINEKFDPNKHEALMKQPSEQPENTVIEEIQPGYLLHGKVLKTAKVIISSKQ